MKIYRMPNGKLYRFAEDKAPKEAVPFEFEQKAIEPENKAKKPANKAKKAATK